MEACGLGGGYILPLGCSLVSGWREGDILSLELELGGLRRYCMG